MTETKTGPISRFNSWRKDAWENVLSGTGTSRDKRTGAQVIASFTPQSRSYGENLFFGDDIAARIAELPAREMVREGFKIHVDTAEDEDFRAGDSEDRMEAPKKVMQKMDDLMWQRAFGDAQTMANIHGGALIFLGANDGIASDDPEALREPLNEDQLIDIEFLTVYDRYEVTPVDWYDDPNQANYGNPSVYRLIPTSSQSGIISQVEIHESRFLRFDGAFTSRWRQDRNQGWSDSIYVRIEQLLADYGLAWASVAHLIQDFSQAVFGVQGLADLMGSKDGQLVVDRMIQMDTCRGVARAIPIDAENETFQRMATPIGGLDAIMDRFASRVAAAAGMPLTLLFGNTPGGLSPSDETGVRWFYDRIATEQDQKIRPNIERLVALIFGSKAGPTRGSEPDQWSIEMNPLWQMNEQEQADIRLKQAQVDSLYIGDGVLEPDEVAISRFGGDTYSTDTVLDMELRDEGGLKGEGDLGADIE